MSDELRVDGGATYYRLFDVGYALDLDRAAELLGANTGGRIRLSRDEARAIEIRSPPLIATLHGGEVVIDGNPRQTTLSAHVFDFGVCSLQLRVQAPGPLSWPEFTAFCAAVEVSADLETVFTEALQHLTGRLEPAIERPGVAAVSEEYKVYRIDRIGVGRAEDGGVLDGPIANAISDQQLAMLLVGERRPLSAWARRELVPHRFSYHEDDFAALSWESALVIEPRADDHDIEYVLEFANAQLLELRMYDQRLDDDLPALYDRVEAARARRSPRLTGRFRAVLSDLQTRVADITETVERVENAVKLTNDVYLARVYSAALEIFRERAWRLGINRKLGILRETYAMLNSEAQAARAELLEIAIIVLILVELVLGLLRRTSA